MPKIYTALETCLLHARNLREFFYHDDKRYKTDARPSDFFRDKNEWERVRPQETNWIKKVKNRADKELAHLTYRRHSGTPPEKEWDCGVIQRDFFKVIKVFLDHLPKKYIGNGLWYIKKRCLQVDKSTYEQGVVSTATINEYHTKWH